MNSTLLMAKFFNSQPHEEADLAFNTLYLIHHFFNSQPHEEADHLFRPDSNNCIFSTHSLTKRLTRFPVASHHQAHFFNSQPHEEADETTFQMALAMAFSTHSLTKRLTTYLITPSCHSDIFQLTASRRG